MDVPSSRQVIDILSAAKFITPELGELPPALKARMGDSNKNLVSSDCVSLRSKCFRSNRFYRILAARKLGREQGRGTPPPPHSSAFCSHPNFRAATTRETFVQTGTLVTQGKTVAMNLRLE